MTILYANSMRVHKIFDNTIVKHVVKNLKNRFELSKLDIRLEKSKENIYLHDFGNTPIRPQSTIDFYLSQGLTVRCYTSQYNQFYSSCLKMEQKLPKYDHNFYKLHGHINILCLSKEQKDDLLQQLTVRHEENIEKTLEIF